MSLSSDGILLAVGGPEDDGGKGATWIFKYDGSKYYQLGPKLVDGQSSFSKLGKGRKGDKNLWIILIYAVCTIINLSLCLQVRP